MLRDLQRRTFVNKLAKGFNTSSDDDGINKEICFLTEELGEIARHHRRGDRAGVIDGITDVLVLCLGLYEILGADGDTEVERVLSNNESRRYVQGPNARPIKLAD